MTERVAVTENERLRLERLRLGPFGTNAYIITCRESGESVLVDAPAESRVILEALRGTRPRQILLTHGHADHTGALAEVHRALGVPLGAHEADSVSLPVRPALLLRHGDSVPCGKLALQVLHTPGHTPGSLCFLVDRCLIAGDTLFPGGPGKTWSPAELEQIIASITGILFTLPDDTAVYPGHGDATVLGKEKKLYAAFASRPRDPGLCGDVTW